MKRIISVLKTNFKIILALIIGMLLAGTGVYAATTLASSSVAYDNSTSGGSSTNVKGALDELYDMANELGYRICERAVFLHEEECERTSGGCYADGFYADGSQGTATVTYGNLGTEGTLTLGDAFDCDVNNDGIHHPLTERFYYLKTSGTRAFLIYYNNTVNGEPKNNAGIQYYNTGSSSTDGIIVRDL